MRRARTKLQVSTFPFLAVLLCAMGALVLFLLVMDRRAKLVARNKSRDHQAVIETKKHQLEQSEQAEFEQKKQRVDQIVQAEHKKVSAELRMAQGAMSDAERDLRAQQTRLTELKQIRDRENAELAKLEAVLQEKRAGLKESERLEMERKVELDRLLANIRAMEKKAEDLKNRKEAEKSTYSLVPYKGKRGDSRKPIYVECRRTGWMFHPEKATLEAGGMTPEKLRGEIERRAGELQRESKDTKEAAGKKPYVLFLVRPDGIENYYKANHYLKGFALDFGSEMVDAEWVFDFPTNDVAAAPPLPVPTNEPHTTLRPPGLSIPPLTGASPQVLGTPASEVSKPGVPSVPATEPGETPRNVIRIPDLTQGETTKPRENSLNEPGVPASPPALTLLPAPSVPSIEAPKNVGSPLPLNVEPPPPLRAPAGNLTEVPSVAPPETPTNKLAVPAFVPLWKMPGPTPIAEAGMNANKPIAEAGPPVKPLIPETSSRSSSGSRTPEDLTNEPNESPPPLKLAPFGAEQKEQGDARVDAKQANGGVTARPGTNGKERAPATLSRQLGNKDFVITVDCYADHVTVFPGGQQFRYSANNLAQINQALVNHVKQLIDRRQGTVRGGEPPYRPTIRFQLTPEGHRTYFEAYPQLQSLRVPMTRENLSE